MLSACGGCVVGGHCVQPQARHSDGGVALYLVVLRSSLRSDMCVHSLPTECGLLTAGFEQCVCQDFTNCRFLMVFLCCQALAQDAGVHGQRASQALKFWEATFFAVRAVRCFADVLVDHFLCISLALLPGTSPIVLTQRGKKSRAWQLTLAVIKTKQVRICAVCARQWARRFRPLSHTTLSHTLLSLSHTTFTRTPFTHNFVTTSLSHTSLSHTIFRTQLCHTLSRTVFYIRLCHTQLFTYNLFYFSILHHFLCLSFLPRPSTTYVAHYN